MQKSSISYTFSRYFQKRTSTRKKTRMFIELLTSCKPIHFFHLHLHHHHHTQDTRTHFHTFNNNNNNKSVIILLFLPPLPIPNQEFLSKKNLHPPPFFTLFLL
ncbi:hypothetical protein Pst134EB_008876 [Puccinia striiformis f. sp. tritici]|nr:hypothetical protein Pst134EB_008876 [Puccinia striiformis f. sp. tritici]